MDKLGPSSASVSHGRFKKGRGTVRSRLLWLLAAEEGVMDVEDDDPDAKEGAPQPTSYGAISLIASRARGH